MMMLLMVVVMMMMIVNDGNNTDDGISYNDYVDGGDDYDVSCDGDDVNYNC